MKKISMSSAKGAMQILLNGEVVDIAQAMGVTAKDWDLVVSAKHWQGADRPRVENVLKSLLNATVDRMGLPRFELPAEYIAAGIALFVHPINYQAACYWVGTNSSSSESLANYQGIVEPIEGFEKVTAQQVFALVCEIVSGDEIAILAKSFAAKSEKKLGFVKL